MNAWGAAREAGTPDDRPPFHGLANDYVPRGYAVAVAHVRGTGESGGCFTVGGPEEGVDGFDIVEALAAEPWSNGKVGMFGGSYVGTTPLWTAVHNPPHLAAIISVASVTEWYRYYFENGEHRMNGSPPPGASYPDPALWFGLGVLPGARTLTTSGVEDAQCPTEFWQEFWAQDDYSTFFKNRDIASVIGNSTVPTLYIQGWPDRNVAHSMIPRFWPNVTSEKRAIFSQHDHGVPASKEDVHAYEHRWLDHYLLGKENGALLAPPVIIEDQNAQWRSEQDWPPADAVLTRFHLAPGSLQESAPAAGSASFTDDGVGTLAEDRDGVTQLWFKTEPFETAVQLAGEPVAHLAVETDGTDAVFTVLLFDVAPDGTPTAITRGFVDARHRDSLTTGADVTPGERYTLEWALHPQDHHVAAGHALLAVVKASDSYIMTQEAPVTNTLHFGDKGSWLVVPLAPVRDRVFSDAMAAPWDVTS